MSAAIASPSSSVGLQRVTPLCNLPAMQNTQLSPEEEAHTLIRLCQEDLRSVVTMLESQLNTIHARAQVLLSFCGIVITTTGFSGRLIAGTHTSAQICIIVGLVLMICCAAYVFSKVGSVRWITREFNIDRPIDSLTRVLRRRDAKTAAYRISGYLLLLGLVFYAISIAIMLLNPHPLNVPVR